MAAQQLPTNFLSPERVAEMLGVSVATLASWRSRGKHLSYFRFGGVVGYSPDDVAAFVERSRVPVATTQREAV